MLIPFPIALWVFSLVADVIYLWRGNPVWKNYIAFYALLAGITGAAVLALVSTVFFSHLVVFYPITTELTAWYAIDFTIALVIALVLAAYGFYISLGGQKLLSRKLLEE